MIVIVAILMIIAFVLAPAVMNNEAIKIYRELTVSDAKGINNYLWAIAECYEGKGDWKNATGHRPNHCSLLGLKYT